MDFFKGSKKDIKELIKITKNVLKLLYFIIIIVGVYLVFKLATDLKIFEVINSIFKILIPLFIGVLIAWLLNPIINWLQKKGIRRKLGTILAYIVLIAILYLIIIAILPLLYNQVVDLVSSLPSIFEDVKNIIDGTFNKLNNIDGLNIESTKNTLVKNVSNFLDDLYISLPSKLLQFLSSFISGIGTFLMGLLIGFFLLINSDNANIVAIEFIPTRYRKSVIDLFTRINKSLRKYVNGALFDALIVFVISTIAFAIIGIQSPVLFGLFCGITNIIPYIGPYIGGAPAVLVAFSQSTGMGIATLISVFVIQFIEGNILQTLIISKATKLNPVTIIIGLLIFGHFFGMVGMLLSTPIIGVMKVVFQYFDEKYDLIKEVDEPGVEDAKK